MIEEGDTVASELVNREVGPASFISSVAYIIRSTKPSTSVSLSHVGARLKAQ